MMNSVLENFTILQVGWEDWWCGSCEKLGLVRSVVEGRGMRGWNAE